MSAAAGRSRARGGAAVVALLVGALVAGCGNEAPPGEEVPALAEGLERVDAAVVDEDHSRARDELESLVAATTEAEEAGEISADEADRIRAAAQALLERLPDEPPVEQPTPEPSPEPTPTEDRDDKGEKDDDKDDEEDNDEEKDNKGDKGNKGKEDD